MIGIFDSGIGGFTVVREIMRRMPEYKLLYFGDTARTPYGQKGAETIKQYAAEAAEFLISRGAKIIVIACNTVSAVAYDYLCEKFPDVPIFEVITPAAEAAARATKNGRIGVIGTRATINSGIYDRQIHLCHSRESLPTADRRESTPQNAGPDLGRVLLTAFCGTLPEAVALTKGEICGSRVKPGMTREVSIFSAACPLLVPLVEEGWLDAQETKQIVRKYLYPLKQKQIDTLILGCTHYPLIKNIIRGKIGMKVIVVDSAEEVVGKILAYLQKHPKIDSTIARVIADVSDNPAQRGQFFVSDLTPATELIVKKWLGQNISIVARRDNA